MPDNIDRVEEIIAKRQKHNEYLSKLIAGKIVVVGNGPEPQNKTKIIYVDHTSSYSR